jgi:hypothetical protein
MADAACLGLTSGITKEHISDDVVDERRFTGFVVVLILVS